MPAAREIALNYGAIGRNTPIDIGTETSLRGSDNLLVQLQNHIYLANISAYSAIRELLTFGERIPYNQALESLTPFEQEILERTRTHPEVRIAEPKSKINIAEIAENPYQLIQQRRVGHISILTPEEVDEYDLRSSNFVVGTLTFSKEDHLALNAAKKDYDQHFLHQALNASSKLKTMEENGQLQPIISTIQDNLMRIGPTFMYVGHHLYSTFDRAGKNLVDRTIEGGNRKLSILTRQPVDIWLPQDQVYVYSTHLLLASGGPARFEEFNGGQLSLDILSVFFDKKAQFYSQYLQQDLPTIWPTQTLKEKAIYLREKLQEVNLGFQRYRIINGLNIRQEEKILGTYKFSVNEELQTALNNKIKTVFGIEKAIDETDQQYRQRVTRDVIHQEITTVKSSLEDGKTTDQVMPLSLLIWSIISAAAEATKSDYGISSTFRDIHKLITKGPLSLEKDDFYCCVVPSETITSSQTNEQIAEVSQIMANRMEFNRWHFIPGNIQQDKIPPKRDWLYPPAIPDISTETDWHHGGHINAIIHHSLRFPSAITIAEKEYRGSYDIRFIRQSGKPYNPDDIKTAKTYLNALGIVLQTISEYIETTNEAVIINGFTTKWYRNGMWRKYINATT